MVKKKDEDVVSNRYDVVREQLGLPVYSYREEMPEPPNYQKQSTPIFPSLAILMSASGRRMTK